MARRLVAVSLALVVALLPTTTDAQAPQVDQPWQGALPGEGVALLAMTRDESSSAVAARLQQEGCNVTSMAVTETGEWLVFVPGAPDFVNTSFPATLGAGRGFAVRCAPATEPLALTEADDGRTVQRAVHQTLRVSLPANPSTGYAWRVDPDLPPSVLVQVGEPETVSPPMPGAPGVTSFEFLATGPGLVPLRLVYDRTFEADSAIDEWSVTVIVTGQQAVAWLGEIRTQPQAAPGARYLEIRSPLLDEGALPRGVAIQGSDGATANAIEALTDTGAEVLAWGELTCGVAAYGGCRLEATSIVDIATDQVLPPSPVVGWAGTVRAIGAQDLFQLEGELPIQYGIQGATDDVQAQLDEARATGQGIRLWGELRSLVDDVNQTRIVVTEIGLAP